MLRRLFTRAFARLMLAWLLHTGKVKAVLFDCDGTAANSDPEIDRLVAQFVTQTFRQKGLADFEHSASENKRRFRGCTYQEILEILASENGLSFTGDELSELLAVYNPLKVSALLNVRPAPGIEEVLRRLQQAGILVAMVSSSSLAAINACLVGAKLQEHFLEELIFSAAESLGYFSQKPEPDIYLHVLKVLKTRGIDPGQVVVVEDSGSGITSAIGALIRLVVAYGGCLEGHEQKAHSTKCFGLGAKIYIRHWAEFCPLLRL